MINDELLEKLRYKGESTDLDFKQAQYPFANATDHQKSELLKDVLAMANAYRDGPGYILIGFKDQAPHPAVVVGIGANDHLDDATLQQFVHSKVEPKLEFHYVERMHDGKPVAIISIPKQSRPFFPTRDYGKLRKNAVYVRRGSSTDEASPMEVARIGLADTERTKKPQVELLFHDSRNQTLAHAFELSFLEFDELPDYEPERSMFTPLLYVNDDYWRDGAEYHSSMNRLVQVRLVLSNSSDFALSEAKLEMLCDTPEGEFVKMIRADELPDEPDSSTSSALRGLRGVVERLQERVTIDERGDEPVCHVRLGTLRPGETGRMEEDVAILPSGPGQYRLRVRILASEISPPIVVEHEVEVRGSMRQMNLEDLQALMYAKYLRDHES